MSLLDVIAHMIEVALGAYEPSATKMRDQLLGTQVAPAGPGARGTVALSGDAPQALGAAAAGATGEASDAGHVHPADASVGTALREAIDDAVAGLLQAGGNISLTYDDTAGTLTISVSGVPAHTHAYVTGVSGTAPIVSSGGASPAISISVATDAAAGSMSASDKAKLDGITAGADPTGATIHGAAAKATPIDADALGLVDSAAANALKQLSWANLKATLKTYLDTLYATTSAASLSSGTLDDARLSSNVPLKNAANTFSANQAVTGTLASTGDMFPAGAGSGLAARVVDYGLTPTEHFRSGSIPSGFAWVSDAVFGGAPASVTWSRSSDYGLFTGTSGTRHFLARSISTFLGRAGYLRGTEAFNTIVGLRVDDGTDSNYYELYVADAGSGLNQIRLRQRTGGAAAVTTNGPSIAKGIILPIMLYSNNPSGSTHYPYCYIIGESLLTMAILTGTAATWTASRFGLIVHDGAAVSVGATLTDWLHWTYA